jgi:hypothetical protein
MVDFNEFEGEEREREERKYDSGNYCVDCLSLSEKDKMKKREYKYEDQAYQFVFYCDINEC